ncbi:hypothetical protein LCGC14_2109420 [marine sediment metagenome]|uniref:Uncharacterized protein n=1 Tax=marine sediment metagenome TaxID=412755 RepID=A0A0F9GKQ5_9ZZZZ
MITPSQWDSENSPPKAIALADIPSVEFVVGAEGSNIINVALQVVDSEGQALALQLALMAWLSDTEAAAMTLTAPSVGASIGTNGVIVHAPVTDTLFYLLTDTDGALDLDIEEALVDTWYLNVRLPGGEVVSSAAITFA